MPSAAIAAAGWSLAWREGGSTDAADWLPYAVGATLVLVVLLASGAAIRPPTLAAAGVSGLVALAGWEAISLSWSPLPALARDDALLTAFYAVAVAVPVLSLRGGERAAVATLVAIAAAALAVSTSVELLAAAHPVDLYWQGNRLGFPVDYPNGVAAVFLVGFWPALLLSARRTATLAARALALGGAFAILAGWLLAQSKGAGIALAVSVAVVLAVSPERLRLLVPLALCAGASAAAYQPLTEPYRTSTAHAIRHAGAALLVVTGVGLAAGAVYALADRRIRVAPRARRLAGRLALIALLCAVVGAIGGFFVAERHPERFLQDRWHSFKHLPSEETAGSHFLSLGSNRYDFWRVALGEFEHHPVAGIGGRGFEAAYLQKRRSGETPARSHSLELDLLSEEGIVGLVLLAAALAPLLFVAGAGARSGELAGTAALGAGAYFVVHFSGDWVWTFPAVGVPVFLLLGASASRRRAPLRARVALPLAAVATALAAFAFAPPWLSDHITNAALRDASTANLDWARRLDPLSVEPLVAESDLAATPEQAVPPLERAVRKEPRSAGLRYELGLAYQRAGRRDDARRELLAARALDPDDFLISQALRRLGGASG